MKSKTKPTSRKKYPAITALRRKVNTAMVFNHEKSKFLPYDQLAKLVTPSAVTDVLKDAGVSCAESLTEFVLNGNARRLFLILVLMSRKKMKFSMLTCFKQSKITDASLPIKFDYDDDSDDGDGNDDNGDNDGDDSNYDNDDTDGTDNTDGIDGTDSTLHCSHWTSLETGRTGDLFGVCDPDDLLLVEYNQWELLAPVFSLDPFRIELNKKRVLPYLQAEPKPASSGFFGEVSQIKVHPAHIPSLINPVSLF